MLKNGLYAPFLRNSKEIRSFFGGLKSAAMSAKHHQAKSMTILTEPMALLKPNKMWVMDRAVAHGYQNAKPTALFLKGQSKINNQ